MVATSFVSIPNMVMKKRASSGLKTIYARKLAKTIVATHMRTPIARKIMPGGIGSHFFCGEGGALSHHHWVSVVHVAVCFSSSFLLDCESISARSELLFSGDSFWFSGEVITNI